MTTDFLSIIIILLISIAIGMAITIAIRPQYKYHGPNAMNHIKKIHQSGRKCYKFGINLVNCP